jgi:hypothetical protein
MVGRTYIKRKAEVLIMPSLFPFLLERESHVPGHAKIYFKNDPDLAWGQIALLIEINSPVIV